MFFKKDHNKKKTNFLIKVCSLLIHAAKIDEIYSKNEEKIIEKTLQLKLCPINFMKIMGY